MVNILTAKGGSVQFIHPFKLSIFPNDNPSAQTDQVEYKTYLNWHSALYDNIETPLSLGKMYLNFKKITVNNLNFTQIIPKDLYVEQYYYCVLNIKIQNFKVSRAEIVFKKQSDRESIVPIMFESEDNLKQTEARIVLAAIAYDDKLIAETEFSFDSNTNSRNIKPEVYVIQYVTTNLIMTNMIFNGVPVLYPAPFGGCITSVDGSDRLI